MCIQGTGLPASTAAKAWWMVLSGQTMKSAPMEASFLAESSISPATASQSPARMAFM
jgi:hypothetical protein